MLVGDVNFMKLNYSTKRSEQLYKEACKFISEGVSSTASARA